MNPTLAGFLQVGLLLVALAVCYKPLGDYIARVFTSDKDLRVESVFYRRDGHRLQRLTSAGAPTPGPCWRSPVSAWCSST